MRGEGVLAGDTELLCTFYLSTYHAQCFAWFLVKFHNLTKTEVC